MRYTNRRLPLPLPLLEGKSRSNLLVVHARLSMYLVRAINNSSDRQTACTTTWRDRIDHFAHPGPSLIGNPVRGRYRSRFSRIGAHAKMSNFIAPAQQKQPKTQIKHLIIFLLMFFKRRVCPVSLVE